MLNAEDWNSYGISLDKALEESSLTSAYLQSPRRPFDNDYTQFILVTSRLLATSLTSILLHEEDLGRRERTISNAEAMKKELREQLLESEKEVKRSLMKFQRFAERADVGIFILDMEGTYLYRNKAWYNICAPEDPNVDLDAAWIDVVDPEYAPLGQAKFAQLVEKKQHQQVCLVPCNDDQF